MSIKLLLFLFTFLFFPKNYYSRENIQNYCNLIKDRVIKFNTKNPKLLNNDERAIIYFVIEFQILVYPAYKKEIKEDLKQKPDKTWNSLFKKRGLVDFCDNIAKDNAKDYDAMLTRLNNDSFTKQINKTIIIPKNKLLFNGNAIWRKYQLILLEILMADFFNIDTYLPIDPAFNKESYLKKFLDNRSPQKLKNSEKRQKINDFLNNYLVKFAIDWKAIEDTSTAIDQQPLLPIDNDTFLELFKDNPVDLINVKIPADPKATLSMPTKEPEENKWYRKKKVVIPGALSLSAVGSVALRSFSKKKRIQNPTILIRALDKNIKRVTEEKDRLQQQNNQPINHYS